VLQTAARIIAIGIRTVLHSSAPYYMLAVLRRKQSRQTQYIEAISAREATTVDMPNAVQTYDQKTPASPPFARPCVFAL